MVNFSEDKRIKELLYQFDYELISHNPSTSEVVVRSQDEFFKPQVITTNVKDLITVLRKASLVQCELMSIQEVTWSCLQLFDDLKRDYNIERY